jgi:hypothetical protein
MMLTAERHEEGLFVSDPALQVTTVFETSDRAARGNLSAVRGVAAGGR